MKGKFKRLKLSKSIKEHSFYYRILVSFSIFSILIVCVTAWSNWNLIASKYETKNKEINRQLLRQTQIYTDHQLYGVVTAILNDNFLNGFSHSDLDPFFLYGKQADGSAILKSYQLINDICNKYSFVKNITLYQKQNDILIDSTYGLSYNALENFKNIDKSLPFSYYNKTVFNTKNQLQYIPSYAFPENERSDLTFVKSLPLYSSFDSSQGYIAINIDETSFLHTIEKDFPLQGGLFILDENNTFLLSLNDSFINYRNFHQIVSPDKLTPSKNYYDFTYQNTSYSYTILQSDSSNWKYIYYIPSNILNADGMAIKQLIIMIVLLTILFSLIAIPVILNHIYRPIIRLRNDITAKHQGLESVNDFDAISNTLTFLESQVDDMEHTISQNKEIMQYKCLTDLLYKNYVSEDDIQKKLSLNNSNLKEDDYCLVILELDKIVFYSLSLEQQEYINVKILEIFKKNYGDSILLISEPYTENRIVALINLSEEDYPSLLKQQYELIDSIRDTLHIEVNIAITDLIEDLTTLKRLHKTISGFFKYSFLYHYGNVFTTSKIKQLDKSDHEWDNEKYHQIETTMRKGHLEELAVNVRQDKEEILSKQYSYKSANDYLIHLYKIVFRIGKEFGILDDKEYKEQVLRDFNYTTYFDESIENILSLLQQFNDTYHNDKESKNTELVKEIIIYINNNPLEELSLSSIAERFKISSSHLSRIFKKVTGENFSKHVVNAKLDTAAMLLTSDPSRSITEIATSLGYYSSSYFTKLFKNKYGITPSQYQKIREVKYIKGK